MTGFVDILGRSFRIEHVWNGCRSVWDVSGLNVVASKTDRSAKLREGARRTAEACRDFFVWLRGSVGLRFRNWVLWQTWT